MAPVLTVHLVGHNGFTDLFDAPKLDWIFSKVNCLLGELVIREAISFTMSIASRRGLSCLHESCRQRLRQ